MLDDETKKLLPSIIKDAMDALTDATNATDEITLPVTLAVASFATQGLKDGNPLLWESCAVSNYFCVLVPSGGLKTSISDLVLKGARKFEEEQRPKAEEAETQYLIDLKKYENEIKEKVKEKPQVPGTGQAPPNPFTKLTKPKYPRTARYMAGKFTLNGIINALKGVPHFGIFNSDAGEFFNSHAFKDPTSSMELVSALSRLWSGEQIDKLTGVEDVSTKGKRLTALFMLQQQLADFFINPQFKDQGFTNRMLITQSEKITKKRADFSDAGLSAINVKDDRLLPFNDRVYTLLSSVDKTQQIPLRNGLLAARQALIKQQNNNEEKDQNTLVLDRQPICLTDNTRSILEHFYNDMVDKMEDPKYVEYQNFISRAYEHCVRLATVLSLFEQCDEVDEVHAKCSVGLMYYFIDQRMNLTIDGSVKIDPIVQCCHQIKSWLIRHHLNVSISKTQLNNNGPKMYKEMKVDDRDKVLAELASRDMVEFIQVGKAVHLIVRGDNQIL